MFSYITEKKDSHINTVRGKGRYFGTEIENEQEQWDDSYTTKAGFWVIHNGTEHHIYKVSL